MHGSAPRCTHCSGRRLGELQSGRVWILAAWPCRLGSLNQISSCSTGSFRGDRRLPCSLPCMGLTITPRSLSSAPGQSRKGMLWLLALMHLSARRILPSDYWTRFAHWCNNQRLGRNNLTILSNAHSTAGDVGNGSLTRDGMAKDYSDSRRVLWEKKSRPPNKRLRKARRSA